MVDPRIGIAQAPGEGGQRPEEQLKVRTRKPNPQPFGFFREKPCVAYVAIESRLKAEQQKPHLVHLAAKMFAGEPVRKLVSAYDKKNNRQQQRQCRELKHS